MLFFRLEHVGQMLELQIQSPPKTDPFCSRHTARARTLKRPLMRPTAQPGDFSRWNDSFINYLSNQFYSFDMFWCIKNSLKSELQKKHTQLLKAGFCETSFLRPESLWPFSGSPRITSSKWLRCSRWPTSIWPGNGRWRHCAVPRKHNSSANGWGILKPWPMPWSSWPRRRAQLFCFCFCLLFRHFGERFWRTVWW